MMKNCDKKCTEALTMIGLSIGIFRDCLKAEYRSINLSEIKNQSLKPFKLINAIYVIN